MKTRTRLAAIIIKDNKLLLVKGHKKFKDYWTPGGRPEQGESDKETLSRELKEELNVEIVDSRFFKEYICDSPYTPDVKSISKAYITKIKGEPKPSAEITEYAWMSREDFENKKYSLVSVTQEQIIPDLIKENIF
jgi:8-oxo-dGTP diphosphatase